MVLKRKRSESEFSFNSNFSTPPRPDTSSFEFSAMGPSSWTMLGSRSSTPSHLPSRTMKRFRDNRPSEAEVHQRTLNLLYSAQQHKTCEPQPQPDAVMAAPPPSQTQSTQQRSLHSFWRLPSQSSAPSVASSRPVPQQNTATNCEDCGAGLGGGNDMMELDDSSGNERNCGSCGKAVCFSCSVSRLGEHRKCLVCAKGRVWTVNSGSSGVMGWVTRVEAC